MKDVRGDIYLKGQSAHETKHYRGKANKWTIDAMNYIFIALTLSNGEHCKSWCVITIHIIVEDYEVYEYMNNYIMS